jgi:hypothetical protein
MYLQAELDEAMTFVAFDRRLTDVARREGLPIA